MTVNEEHARRAAARAVEQLRKRWCASLTWDDRTVFEIWKRVFQEDGPMAAGMPPVRQVKRDE